MSKIILNQCEVKRRRVMVVAAAFGILGTTALTACSEPLPTASQAASWEVDQLGSNKNSKMVQGREACINELLKSGKSRTEANRLCDEAGGSRQNFANTGGGNSNAMLWYLIGRNSSVSSYTGNPDTGFNRYGTSRAASGAPATISPTQGEYLSARTATARAGIISTGGRYSSAAISRVASSPSFATSRGGMSSGHGVSMGG